MMNCKQKLLKLIETTIDEFPKVEPVMVGKTSDGTGEKTLVAVQRVESFDTLFNISISVAGPLAGMVTISGLKSCIDPDDKPTVADQVEIEFTSAKGARELRDALLKRLARGDINTLAFATPRSQLLDLDADGENTVVLPRPTPALIDPDRQVAGHDFDGAKIELAIDREATNPFIGVEGA